MFTTPCVRRLSLTLLAGTAAVAIGHPAWAQDTEIDSETTTPVLTSESGDLAITADGSIVVTDGTALTIDSENSVTNDGEIVVEDPSDDGSEAADGAGAVLIDAGGGEISYLQEGTIRVEDNSPADDDEEDGLTPPDYADDRYGLRLEAGDYTGQIGIGDGADIVLRGDNSVGIDLIGNLIANADDDVAVRVDGDITLNGAGSTAVNLAGDVTGDVEIGGSFNVVGEDSDGVVIDGNIDGALLIDGYISTTGYLSLSQEDETDDPDAAARNDIQRQLTAGDAVSIGGDVTGGILFDGALPSEFSEVERSAIDSAASVYGSGYALRLDGGAGGMTVGLVSTEEIDEARATVEDNSIPDYGDYGVVLRGSLTSNGVFDGVTSNAVLIQNADIEGGLRNDGTISSQSLRAAVTTLEIGAGAVVPVIHNRDTISASAFGSGGDAIGILLGEGSTVSTFENDGTLEAYALSDDSDVVALRDLGGSLTELTNSGVIYAVLGDDSDNDPETEEDNPAPVGDAVAIDLRANTTGVSITNTVTSRPNVDIGEVGRESFGVVIGDVYTGSGNDSYVADAGYTDGNVDLGAGDDMIDLSRRASIVGDISFGDGMDSLYLDNAAVTGAVDFGAGDGTLSLVSGAELLGNISSSGLIDVMLSGSLLYLGAETDLNVGTMTVTDGEDGDASVVGFAIADGNTSFATIDAVSVDIASGTTIRPIFEGAFDGNFDEVILSSTALNIDGGVDSLIVNEPGVTPYLFDQSLTVSEDGNDLILHLDRKSAEELGLGTGFAGALDPAITSLTQSSELGSVLFNATSQEEFDDLFKQVVGGPLDAPMAYARAQNSSVTSLISHRVDAITSGDDSRRRRFWLQEEGYFLNRDEDADSNGFDGGGFVVALGADAPVGPVDVVGVSFHYASARYDEQAGEDFPFDRITYGLDAYFAEQFGKFELDGRAGFGISSTESERNVDFGTGTNRLNGDWDGTQITANSRLRYNSKFGKTAVKPFVSLDFVSITDDAYTEEGEEALVLSAEERDAESLRANVGLELSREFSGGGGNYGYEYGAPGVLRPRLTAAWSQELITDDYEAVYNFGQPGEADKFTLYSEPESGSAIIGTDISYENEYAVVQVGASGQFGEQTEVYTVRFGVGLKW